MALVLGVRRHLLATSRGPVMWLLRLIGALVSGFKRLFTNPED